MEAGRIMLRELHRLADERQSFAFESTLASRTLAPWIRQLIDDGYEFVLGYVWVESPDISVERVAARSRAGGHHVAEEIVRRRWQRSVDNFFGLYLPLSHQWYGYDNSARGAPIEIAEGGSGQTEVILNPERWQLLMRART